jgi:hypothetical protein
VIDKSSIDDRHLPIVNRRSVDPQSALDNLSIVNRQSPVANSVSLLS